MLIKCFCSGKHSEYVRCFSVRLLLHAPEGWWEMKESANSAAFHWSMLLWPGARSGIAVRHSGLNRWTWWSIHWSIDRCCRWPLCSAKDDGIDIDALAAEIEGAGASKETKGKKKKKGAKKEDFEYETTPPLSLYPPSLYLMLQKVHTINLILVMVIFVISHKLSLFSFLGEMWKRF